MADRTCTGECLKCSFQQQTYCSAQRTYAILKNQEAIVNRLDILEDMLSRFDSKDIMPLEDGAQNGPGADNRGQKEQP